MTLTPLDKLAAARLIVQHRAPYLQSMLMSLIPVAIPGMGRFAPAGVDARHRLAYDPDSILDMGTQELATVLEHECYHLVYDHWGRKGERHPMLWNLAGDCEINDGLLRLPKRPTPFPLVTPKAFKLQEDELAEWYYDHWPQPPGGHVPGKTQNSPRQGGDRSGDASAPQPAPGAGQCGSCSGNPAPWEEQLPKDAPAGIEPQETDTLRRAVARDVIAHSKQPGTVPGDLVVWARSKLTPPTLDWRRVLAQRIRAAVAVKAGASDYTYKRFSRRQWSLSRLGRAAILPGMHQPMPKVVLVLDTSGSMLGPALEKCFAEAMGVVKALGAPVEALAYDAALQGEAKIQGVADLAKIAKGGGGTDMAAALRLAAAKRPDVIVLLTDLYTPWPSEAEIQAMPRLVVAAVSDAEVPPYIRTVLRVTP